MNNKGTEPKHEIIVGGRGNGKSRQSLIRVMEELGVPSEVIKELLEIQFDNGYNHRKRKELMDAFNNAPTHLINCGCANVQPFVMPKDWLNGEVKVLPGTPYLDHELDRLRYGIMSMGQFKEGIPMYEKAKKKFYYTTERRKGTNANLGDIVYVEHPNKDMEGFYQRITIDGQAKYIGITTAIPRIYLAKDLEKYERAIKKHGTITHIVKGLNVHSVLLGARGAEGLYSMEQAIKDGIKMYDLRPTKEEQVRPLQDALKEFTRRYNHNVSEANKVKSMLEEISLTNEQLAAKMHDIDKSIKEILNDE